MNNADSSALRELGKVVRTVFLLRHIEDIPLRKTINAAINMSEEFNGFPKWHFFGDACVIAENNQQAQCTIVQYKRLASNMMILHNVVQLTWQPVEKPNYYKLTLLHTE